MPTAIDVIVKDGSGGGLRWEHHELCALSSNSSDEPTEVIVLLKEEGDEPTEECRRTGASKPSDPLLTEEENSLSHVIEVSSAPPSVTDKKSPPKKLSSKALELTDNNWNNNANLTRQQVRGGVSKENSSPQKEVNNGADAVALGYTKMSLFGNGGGSDDNPS